MRLTFLTYCPRSGSTKLAQMLSAHCMVLPEFRLPIRHIEQRVGNATVDQARLLELLSTDSQLEENLGFDDADCAKIAAAAGPGMAGAGRAVVSRWSENRAVPTPGTAMLKLGRLIEHADAVMDDDATTRVVFIVRDPRAVVRSMQQSRPPRAGGGATFSHGNPYFAVRMWRRRLVAYEHAVQRYGTDRVTSVRFEDLGDPAEIERLVDFVGRADQPVPFAVSEREQTLHTKVDDSFNVNLNQQWHDDLSPGVVRNIEALCHDELRRLGYPTGDRAGLGRQALAQAVSVASRPIDISSRAVRRLRLSRPGS